jgi:predicted DNA-binding transcriptional regulator AlpA
MFAEEYLKIPELAARLKLSRKTIRNKMSAGVFIKGVHYFSPKGMGTRFKWSAIVEWMEAGDNATAADDDSIPMARGYRLGDCGR